MSPLFQIPPGLHRLVDLNPLPHSPEHAASCGGRAGWPAGISSRTRRTRMAFLRCVYISAHEDSSCLRKICHINRTRTSEHEDVEAQYVSLSCS